VIINFLLSINIIKIQNKFVNFIFFRDCANGVLFFIEVVCDEVKVELQEVNALGVGFGFTSEKSDVLPQLAVEGLDAIGVHTLFLFGHEGAIGWVAIGIMEVGLWQLQEEPSQSSDVFVRGNIDEAFD
jgi:hypothetical protein